MRAFSIHRGVAAPIRRDNIDTDIIAPMQHLLSVPLAKLGSYAFGPIRYRPDGSEDPSFVLNQDSYRHASILVCGRNFGGGSSREAAVTAIAQLGVRVIIAPSFGDIFYGNCFKNGLLPVRLAESGMSLLMDRVEQLAGAKEIEVDLVAQRIAVPGLAPIGFEVEPGLRQRLLTGEDEIALTLRYKAEILAYQDHDRRARPWIWDFAPVPL